MIKLLRGSSFQKTYLHVTKKKTFVRKKIFINIKNKFNILEKQSEWMSLARKQGLPVPIILSKKKTNSYFYYDVEYLENYENLSQYLQKKNKIPDNFFSKLNTFYDKNHSIGEVDQKLLPNLFKIKIVPSVNSLKKKYPNILRRKKIIINGISCNNLLEILDIISSNNTNFSRMVNKNFDQKYKTIIHGDLTFENILIKDNLFFFIDPYGGFLDYKSKSNIFYKTNILFDLGKICQSFISEYEKWNKKYLCVCNINKNPSFNLNFIDNNFDKKFKFLEKKYFFYNIKEFHLILKIYLIVTLSRIIRYKINQPSEDALISYLIATYWANKIIENK